MQTREEGSLAKKIASKYAAIVRMNSPEESHMQWTSEQPRTGHSLCWRMMLKHKRSSDIHAMITASVQTVFLLLSSFVPTDHILCRCILYGCWLPHSPRNILSLFQRSGSVRHYSPLCNVAWMTYMSFALLCEPDTRLRVYTCTNASYLH